MYDQIDILEDYIVDRWPDVFEKLLIDHTKSQFPADFPCTNIVWATNSYAHIGNDYAPQNPILTHLVTKENGRVIQPRAVKSRDEQILRTKDMAEVFTPSWICNTQNNLIDNAWFGAGYENQFNTENADNTWTAKSAKIQFPEGKTWRDYVRDVRLEITCGEAPYLTSRYDTVTGKSIEPFERIGILDRKLRVVSENTETSGDWLDWAQIALKSSYGYEFQGDSLLIARENMFFTFIDFYRQKFKKEPLPKSLQYAAYVISWNLWQMDGLQNTVPFAYTKKEEYDLFGSEIHEEPLKAIIRDWKKKDSETQKIVFEKIINHK